MGFLLRDPCRLLPAASLLVAATCFLTLSHAVEGKLSHSRRLNGLHGCKPNEVPRDERCRYVREHPSCRPEDGWIPYLEAHYCYLDQMEVATTSLFLLWIAILFGIMLIVAERFFCPSLELISEYLRLPPCVAGATLLSFGNGAPDVFTQLAAISQGDSDASTPGAIAMALSEPLGSGLFVGNIVFALVVFFSGLPEVRVQRSYFFKDCLFYLGGVATVFGFLIHGVVRVWEVVLLAAYYLAFILTTILLSRGDEPVHADPRLHEVPHRLRLVDSFLRESFHRRPTDFSGSEGGGLLDNDPETPLLPPNLLSRCSAPALERIDETGPGGDGEEQTRGPLNSDSGVDSDLEELERQAERLIAERLTAEVGTDASAGDALASTSTQAPPPTLLAMYGGRRGSGDGQGLLGLRGPCAAASGGAGPGPGEHGAAWGWGSGHGPGSHGNGPDQRHEKELGHCLYGGGGGGGGGDTNFGRRTLDRGPSLRRENSGLPPGLMQRLWRRLERPGLALLSLFMPRVAIDDHARYRKTCAVLLPPLLPTLVGWSQGWLDDQQSPGGFWTRPWWQGSTGLGLAVAGLAMVYYPRKGHLHGVAAGIATAVVFCQAMLLLDAFAGELVSAAVALGQIFGISPSLLGATLLAWGNSVSDLVSNITLARDGLPSMAITACFASPLFVLLAGLVTSLTYGTRHGDMQLPRDLALRVLYGCSTAILLMWAVVVPLVFRFRLSRRVGFLAVAAYAIYQSVYIWAVVHDSRRNSRGDAA